MTDRLLIDLGGDGRISVGTLSEGRPLVTVWQAWLAWPIEGRALEDLRWYLEDFLRAPFGVWENRGPEVAGRLAGWGAAVFASVFGSGPARDAYQRAVDSGAELVFRSDSPELLGLPWELMSNDGRPAALTLPGVSRALLSADLTQRLSVSGERLRVLMVISRPAGARDVDYQMIARPLVDGLAAVRGEVDVVVLRPPTLEALRETLTQAAQAGDPFQVVHFDGHGTFRAGHGGLLVFEAIQGGSHPVSARRVAAALHEGRVPVVVLNACQSGAVGAELGASVATALVQHGATSVVAMAYSVYAVAAAEFMTTFYERLFAADTVSAAVTAGRMRMFEHAGRPSPKGDYPLADWLVPVHYLRQDVSFPQAASRAAAQSPRGTGGGRLREPGTSGGDGTGSLDPVGPFLGRDDLFYEIEAAAQRHRVIVLQGPAGAGKTELAKAFGRWWQTTGGVDQPEWVLWHSFEPGVASFGLDGVVTGIGIRVFGPGFARKPTTERRQAVEDLLADRRLLLIWDNFETVWSMPDQAGATTTLDEAGRRELKDFLDGLVNRGRSTVIMTSRAPEEWLGPVRRIMVGGLAPAVAAAYAAELLAPFPAARPQMGRRAFGELLEWLDGHPLSMRLVVPRLAAADPEELLESLRGTVPLPDGDKVDGDRITSLEASLAYSFTHLPNLTRRLLPAVSLFRGVTDAVILARFSAAAGVPARFSGVSARDWGAILKDVARVGLLTPLSAGRYKIHPALPAYVAARWQAEDPAAYDHDRDSASAALTVACAEYGSWLSSQIKSGDAGSARTLTGLHRRTLGIALAYALDHQLWAYASKIIRPLDDFLGAHGLGEEAKAWTKRTLAAIENHDGTPPALDTSAGNLWLFVAGAHAQRQQKVGRYKDARDSHLQMLGMLEAQPSSPVQLSRLAVIHERLGLAAYLEGRPDEAEDWHRKALAINEELGERAGVASSYHQLGAVAQSRTQLDDAEDWYRRALTIREELRDQRGVAASYHRLGMLAKDRGRLEEAEDWYLRSLAIYQRLGNMSDSGHIYHLLGQVAYQRKRLAAAEERFREALLISENLGTRPAQADTYLQLGNIAADRRRLKDADDWYRKSLTTEESLGRRKGVAVCYHQLGNVAYRRGQLADAEDWYRKSIAIKEEIEDSNGLALSYHQLGLVAAVRSQLREAEDWYRKSLAITEKQADQPSMAATYEGLGSVAYRRGRPEDAVAWYGRSRAIREELGDKPGLGMIYHQLGLLAESQGQMREALSWHGKSEAIKKETGDQPGLAATYHQIGNIAYKGGRLDEAEGWYRKSLAIQEDQEDPPGLAVIYGQLGLLAKQRGQLRQALEWTIRCVTLFPEFPHPSTGPGPLYLTRLTDQLGVAVLEECWRHVAGGEVPQAVRDYVSAHQAAPAQQETS